MLTMGTFHVQHLHEALVLTPFDQLCCVCCSRQGVILLHLLLISLLKTHIELLGFIANSTIDDFKCISCVSDALEGMEAGCNDFIP